MSRAIIFCWYWQDRWNILEFLGNHAHEYYPWLFPMANHIFLRSSGLLFAFPWDIFSLALYFKSSFIVLPHLIMSSYLFFITKVLFLLLSIGYVVFIKFPFTLFDHHAINTEGSSSLSVTFSNNYKHKSPTVLTTQKSSKIYHTRHNLK